MHTTHIQTLRLVGLLLPLALAAVTSVVVAAIPLPTYVPESLAPLMFCCGQAIGGLIVAAMSVQLVRTRALWRNCGAVAAFALHCLPLLTIFVREGAPLKAVGALALTIPIVFVATLVLLATLNLGLHWRVVKTVYEVDEPRQPIRFGIARILAVTAAIAMCLSLAPLSLRVFYQEFERPMPADGLFRAWAPISIECGVIAMACVTAGLPVTWAVLSRRLASWRIVAALPGLIASTLMLAYVVSSLFRGITGSDEASVPRMLVYLSIPLHAGLVATVASMAFAARAAGFRLNSARQRYRLSNAGRDSM